MPKVTKPAKQKDSKYLIDHLHNEPEYIEVQPRPILKVKSAAEQHREETKAPDVLLSQEAMRAILTELQDLRTLKEEFSKLKAEREQDAAERLKQDQLLKTENAVRQQERSRSKDKKADGNITSSNELSKRLDVEKSLESSKEETKRKSKSKGKKDPQSAKPTDKKNFQRMENIAETKSKNVADSHGKSQSSLLNSIMKNVPDTSSGAIPNLKESGRTSSSNSAIKVGTAKKLKPSATFTTPKEVFKQFDEIAHEKKDSLRDSKKKSSNQDLEVDFDSEGEDSSIYTEFNEDL